MEELLEEDKKAYEFSYLINTLLSQEEALSLLEKIKGVFLAAGGEIIKEPIIEKQTLAYPIKKQITAYFGYFQVKFVPKKANEIKDHFRYESDLIRYLLVTPPPTAKRLIMQPTDGGREIPVVSEEFLANKEVKEKTEKVEEKASAPVEEKSNTVDADALEQTFEEIEKIS